MNKNFTIKQWAEDDRPREKLIEKGNKTLSNAELVAILLGSGTRTQSAVELAQMLLDSVNNDLNLFSKMSLNDLCKFKGIGVAKASALLASAEIGRRRKDDLINVQKVKITSSKIVYEFLKPIYLDLYIEEFHILILNRANVVLKTVLISKGGMHGTVVDPKVVFKTALEENACAIILSHNHPSGQLKASDEDLKITKKLVEFGKMIDLPILDHLIFTDNGYFSFADNGLI